LLGRRIVAGLLFAIFFFLFCQFTGFLDLSGNAYMYIRDVYALMYMGQVNVITVKVPSELKKKMKQVKVNWSEYIRDSIQRKIEEQKMKAASAKLDEVRARVKLVPTEELVSWISEDRQR
jgi:post-segregation antitoxin (ccd killing protein)